MARLTDVVAPPPFSQTASYTPGPWSRARYGEIVDADGQDVCFRSMTNLCTGPERTIAQAEKNTDLVAAAPELLEALRDALRSSRKDFRAGPEGDRQHREAYAEQFAAIAKAKGGAA